MLRSRTMLVLGIALLAAAVHLEASGLREVSPDEAKLVQGAACPYQGLNQKLVCGNGAVTSNCSWYNTSACGTYSCEAACQVWEEQKASGCDATIGPCSTVPCVPATSTTVACYARHFDQQTCTGTIYCSCTSPTTRFNCPTTETYTKWSSCP